MVVANKIDLVSSLDAFPMLPPVLPTCTAIDDWAPHICIAGSAAPWLGVQESEREVPSSQGQGFAKAQGCLFVETSAKADVAVRQAFEELLLKVLDSPSLLRETGASKLGLGARPAAAPSRSCC